MRVKICGLTNLEDALAAAEAGADLLGFIFYERSPRYVPPAQVAAIVAALRARLDRPSVSASLFPLPDDRSPFTVHRLPTFVGVFVNPTLEQVLNTLDACGLDLAQLHGEEPPELLAALAGRAYKALRPATPDEGEVTAPRYAALGPAEGPDLLVDAYHPTLRGGTGQVGDWALASGLARRHRLLLAGGLTPENVAAAIAQVRPWGVDVAGGVEAAAGRKDHDRLRAFVAAARGAGAA
ncbi:MAG: phosphoribosylanthranilate isomerase [Caldilineales bacterium]|nr:phosphoribosylanthranilate isomerase [Caldilineales bacterium]MDW8317747.1 phosphoribosylanthranilate isomerase [Anaerolineae bacterium]